MAATRIFTEMKVRTEVAADSRCETRGVHEDALTTVLAARARHERCPPI